jgi:3-deoxy-D-manno-octulosonic-acid transferase
MLLLYNLGIRLYSVLIQFAYLNSFKARAWIDGRKNIFSRIEAEILPGRQHIWFHFASLGEFEQGRPVLEKMRQMKPESRILITFFSPSGYEIRKDTPLADHVFYLPIDTKANAERFIKLINPSLAIFTKYEYWYYYFTELRSREIPLYIISGIFRKSQPFFKWYGSLHREMLKCVTYFFVQNQESSLLLSELEIKNVAVSGDTRFDRVVQNARSAKDLKEVQDFCSQDNIFIAGSTWPEDEKLIAELTDEMPGWKFIIAPHEISADKLQSLEKRLKGKSLRYSQLIAEDRRDKKETCSVVIIDNIGMLSSLYQYGDIAYIGGGFGAGIHNTLEAAAFGLPVIFGPNYEKFKEASDLIELGAAFSIADYGELKLIVKQLMDEESRNHSGDKARKYVETNTGATDLIMKFISIKPS